MKGAAYRWVASLVRWMMVGFSALVLLIPWIRPRFPVFHVVDSLLAMQCHRLDDRVIEVAGVPMAICSRCAGIYAGVLLGMALMRPRLNTRQTAWAVAGALVAMLLAIGLDRVMGVIHPLRLMSGAALSWPVASLAARKLVRWGRLAGRMDALSR